MVRFVALLLLATGCRQLLGFEELADPIADDARSDGALTDDGQDPDGPPPDTMPPSACPATYTLTIASSASVYRSVTNQAIPWLSANSKCTADGARSHLIVLSNDSERAEIAAATGTLVRWVGFSDRAVDGTFQHVTDENTGGYPPQSGSPWAVGEPMAGTADCAALGNAGELVSLACGNGRTFICECDAFLDDPTNY